MDATPQTVTIKQRLVRRIVGQFGHPEGLAGRLAGWFMAHRPSNLRRSAWVVSLLDVQPTDRVLEIGFGPGIAAAVRAGRVQLTCGSVKDLPPLGEPLDAIMAVNSMGFWPEPQERLRELRGKLREGGRIAIASQPRCPGATKETSDKAARKIEAMLHEAGFSSTHVETLPLDPPVVCVLGDKQE